MFGGIPCLVPFADVVDVLVGRHVLSGMCSAKDRENGEWERDFEGKIYELRFGFDFYGMSGHFHRNIQLSNLSPEVVQFAPEWVVQFAPEWVVRFAPEYSDRERGMEEFSGGEFLVVFGLLINGQHSRDGSSDSKSLRPVHCYWWEYRSTYCNVQCFTQSYFDDSVKS
ncbi:MAG TPA: hypothetical protein PK559_11065 [Ignavibacteriaceae bacterium]|nr:hypothetical protein [Ignavibacteriaceae bacterium]